MPDQPQPGVMPAPPLAPGQQQMSDYQAAGVPNEQIASWKAQKTADFQAAGVQQHDIDAYFGESPPSSPAVSQAFNANFMANKPVVQTGNLIDNLAAGWNTSVVGMMLQGKTPEKNVLPKGGMALGASVLGQEVGDLLPQLVGAIGGATAGAAVPGGGETGATEVVGGAVGTTALPEAMRQAYGNALRRGEINNFGDFLKVITYGTTETLKAGAAGGVGGVAGSKVAGVVEKAGAPLIAPAAHALTQGVAGTAALGAMNGRMPSRSDLITASVMALGGAAAGKMVGGRFQATPAGERMQNNLHEINIGTGVDLDTIVRNAQNDPRWRQLLLSQDPSGHVTIPPDMRLPDPPPSFDPTKLRNVTPGVDGRPVPMNERAPIPVTGDINHVYAMMQSVEGSHLAGGATAVSPKGAQGLNQIMPNTARQYGFDPSRLMDPAYNTQVSKAILTDLYRRFGGDEEAVLVAYNAGPGRGNELKVAGPGSRLVATADPSVHGGVRYTSEAAARNESFLPLETQKYLANARRHAGGELPGSRGGSTSGMQLALPAPAGGGAPPELPPEHTAGIVPLPEWAKAGPPAEPPEPPPPPAGGEPPEGYQGSTQDAYNDIKNNIGEEDRAPSLFTADAMLTHLVSRFQPFRAVDTQLIKENPELNRDKDMLLEDTFRGTQASPAVVASFVRNGAVTTDPVTGAQSVVPDSMSLTSAMKIAKDAGGTVDDFFAHMIAERVVNREAAGFKTGFNVDAARAILADAGETAKYTKATQAVAQFRKGYLDYAVGKGYLSAAQVAKMMKADPVWLSFSRVMGADAFQGGGVGGKNFKVSEKVKTMQGGSERPILNPKETLVRDLTNIVTMADKNEAIGYVINLAEHGRIAGFEKVNVFTEADLAPEVKDVAKLGEFEDGPIPLPFLATRALKRMGPQDFVYMRNGTPELWHAADPLLAQGIRGAETKAEAVSIFKVWETVSKLQRAGVVNTPDFGLGIALTHQFTAAQLDPLHPTPVVTILRGAMAAVGFDDKLYWDWAINGGGATAATDMDANYFQKNIHDAFEQTGALDKVWNVFSHPLEAWQAAQARLDAMPRIGYFLAAQEKGLGKRKASIMSRKAYMDHTETGTNAQFALLTRLTPFSRASLLGSKQAAEAATDHPFKTSYYLGLGAVAAAVIYAWNYMNDKHLPDGQKWADRQPWEKDTYVIVPGPGGINLKIKAPYSGGNAVMGMTNRFLDAMVAKDPHAFDGWASSVLKDFTPNLEVAGLTPLIENATDHNFTTGQKLIPGSLEKASGPMQYTDNTSETSKALSRILGPDDGGLHLLNVSPIVLDNYVTSLLGTTGMQALDVMNAPFSAERRPGDLSDNIFVKGFVARNPGMNSSVISSFYTDYDKVQTAAADKGLAKKRGNLAEMQSAQNEAGFGLKMTRAAAAIAMQRSLIQAVDRDKDMTVDEKRQRIETSYTAAIAIARQADAAMQSQMGPKAQGVGVGPDVQFTQGAGNDLGGQGAPPAAAVPAPVQFRKPGTLKLPNQSPGDPGLGEPLKVQ